MYLNVLGSSSKGNCYILENDKEALIIEAGIHPKEVKKALNFDISKVKGVFCSHSHGDHSKYLRELSEMGMPIFASEDTLLAYKMGIFTRARNLIIANEVINVGNFKIIPFALNHDVPNLGFYINHPDTGNVLFATDTNKIPYRFDKVSTYIVEANYSLEIINKNIKAGILPYFVASRSIDSHMDIRSAVKFLKSSDLSETKRVVLIHLSGGNSDSKQFKQSVEAATGKNVYIASKGLKLNINNQIF